MAATDKLKQSLYFPEETLREIMKEANRLDRSLSWTVQQAWRLAVEGIKRFPSAEPGAFPREAPPPRRLEPISRDADKARASSQVLEFLRGKFDREQPN